MRYGGDKLYRLIIIDDECKILEGMTNLFPWEEIGFTVVGQFSDSTAAMRFIETNPVDVILSDVKMPNLTGIDICKKLYNNEKIKVVLFSSHQNYEYFRNAIQFAAEDYLLKPVKYPELLACFERVKKRLDEEYQKNDEVPIGYYENIVATTVQYLKENYQNASLEEASERVNLSPSYLSKIYKEKSGENFSETLSSIRMSKAKELLDDFRYKSYDIAYYLGYDNPKNFSRAFKAYFNMSPSEYRNKRQGEK